MPLPASLACTGIKIQRNGDKPAGEQRDGSSATVSRVVDNS